MSKACFDCPFNLTDCYRPQCITGTGIKRQLISVNKQMPGPAIQVCKNDQVVVNIFNELRMGESTSIHWHGMKQKGTPYSDGISMV
jgi:FtsP/CotA-like multicopper oxidase with cupredoxin domain